MLLYRTLIRIRFSSAIFNISYLLNFVQVIKIANTPKKPNLPCQNLQTVLFQPLHLYLLCEVTRRRKKSPLTSEPGHTVYPWLQDPLSHPCPRSSLVNLSPAIQEYLQVTVLLKTYQPTLSRPENYVVKSVLFKRYRPVIHSDSQSINQ